jgi:hypothetical protein
VPRVIKPPPRLNLNRDPHGDPRRQGGEPSNRKTRRAAEARARKEKTA